MLIKSQFIKYNTKLHELRTKCAHPKKKKLCTPSRTTSIILAASFSPPLLTEKKKAFRGLLTAP